MNAVITFTPTDTTYEFANVAYTTDSVDGTGAILTFTLAGTPLYTYEWPNNDISDGGSDQYDGGNYINTNLGTHIPYNAGVINNDYAAFGGSGSSYFAGFKGSVFAMIGTGVNSLNQAYYTGDLGADGGGYEKPRSLYEPTYYIFTTNTLNSNGYVNYQWNTEWYVEVDIAGQQLGNIYINPNNNTIGTRYNNLHLAPAVNSYLNISTADGTNTYTWNFDYTGFTTFPGKITFGQTHYDPPNFADRLGEKVVLWDQSPSYYSYALGIEQDAMWFGVDTNANSNTGLIWYSANTKVMELGRNALLTVNNSIVVKNLKGPYANDSVAASNGVGLKEFYYDASGVVRIRLS